jgi:Fe-S-cluster containining protein
MCIAADVDCEAGRRLGCQTFCCRLLVRLDRDERELARGGQPPKGFMDKDEHGYCVNFDRATHLCRIWAKRPRVCREYDCNGDFLLQVAMRREFRNIVELVKAAACDYIPQETYIHVPRHQG